MLREADDIFPLTIKKESIVKGDKYTFLSRIREYRCDPHEESFKLVGSIVRIGRVLEKYHLRFKVSGRVQCVVKPHKYTKILSKPFF